MNCLLHFYFVWSLCDCANGQFRLPGDVVPTQYDLKILFDVDPVSDFSYYGVVTILMKALKPTSEIILNSNGIKYPARDLKVTQTSPGHTHEQISVTEVILDRSNQFYALKLRNHLKTNVIYSLSVAFSGNLSTPGLPAIFISKFVGTLDRSYEEGYAPVSYSIGTKFEPIGARTLFPCFDEPEYKAAFVLTLGHHQDFTATVSNMPRTTVTKDVDFDPYFLWEDMEKKFMKEKSQFVWDVFEKTGTISTYLFGFVISKYQRYEDTAQPLTKIGIWTKQAFTQFADDVSDTAKNAMSFYATLFNMPCDVPYLDHIFHEDFEVVSSTSWGFINYANILLFARNYALFLENIDFVQAISKATAMQWFGNSIKWWNDRWLKEGCALYLSQLSLFTVLKNREIPESALVLPMLMEILEKDSFELSKPVIMSVEMSHPLLLHDYSDGIEYLKVAYLVRMLHKILGDELFKDALHNYLIKYSFESSDPESLWEEMNKVRIAANVHHLNVTEEMIMNSWLRQRGYPLLTVTRNYYNNSFAITQRRYVSNINTTVSMKFSHGWWVPLRIIKQGEEQAPVLEWLSNVEGTSKPAHFQHGAPAEDWILFNVDLIAPYRVNYDRQNWYLLSNSLAMADNRTLIPALNRAQLLADAYELARIRLVDYSLVFDLTKNLVMERDPDVLENGFSHLATIGMMLQRTPEYDKYAHFAKSLIENHTNLRYSRYFTCIHLSRDDIHYKEYKLCLLLSELGCEVNIEIICDYYENLFKDWMMSHLHIEPHLKKQAYCAGVSRGGKDAWEFLLRTITELDDMSADYTLIVNGLACTRQPWLLHRTLQMLVKGEFNVGPNIASLIKTALHNPVGYYVGKEFMYKRSHEIFNGFSAKITTVAFITYLLDQINDQRDLDEFSTWRSDQVEALSMLGVSATVERAYQAARRNVDWITENRQEILDQLDMSERTDVDLTTHSLVRLEQNNCACKIIHTEIWLINFIYCLSFLA